MSENILTDEEALQNFLLDIQCLDELLPWTGKFNLFDVLKVSRKEIRHSNMLGWLMDPNENHGFGDLGFTKKMICITWFMQLLEMEKMNILHIQQLHHRQAHGYMAAY